MDNRKIIVFCYIVAGIVVWYLSRSSIGFLYVSFYQVRRLPGILAIKEVLPLILGAALFAYFFMSTRVNSFLEEVVTELRKVTWPARQDVIKSSTVVIVCIVVISFILAGFDLIWGKLITGFLKS